MLRYTSVLNSGYNDELERLMFFNPGQESALASILESIDNYGSPIVYIENERLRVKVDKLNDVQTLFALNQDALVGVLIYSRITPECLTIIHLAVDEDYSSTGKFSHKMLVLRMLELIRNNARRIKSVETIRLMCSGNQFRDYPV